MPSSNGHHEPNGGGGGSGSPECAVAAIVRGGAVDKVQEGRCRAALCQQGTPAARIIAGRACGGASVHWVSGGLHATLLPRVRGAAAARVRGSAAFVAPRTCLGAAHSCRSASVASGHGQRCALPVHALPGVMCFVSPMGSLRLRNTHFCHLVPTAFEVNGVAPALPVAACRR